MGDIQQVLAILSKAIIRETAAFNYYYKQSEDKSLTPELAGLLTRLAEEERVHRRLLMNEYMSIEKGWNESWSEEKGAVLAYPVPDEPPVRTLEVSPCLEARAVALPSLLVGGDNILALVLKDSKKGIAGTFISLYDVMGHGLKTTGINAFANKVLGEYIDSAGPSGMESELLFPRNVIKHLNRKMNERFEGQGVFLTMVTALFHTAAREMTYAIAGHEPPFVIRKDGKVESLMNTQLVVGIDAEYPYRQAVTPFNPGDVFCVFSDGIIETKNPAGDMFGRERISDLLKRSAGKAPDRIILDLLDRLREFAGGTPLDDEVTIVVIAAKGEKE